MQTAAGLMCVLFGLLHFVDRDRLHAETRSFYFNVLPRTPIVRTCLAIIEMAVGVALLFTG